MTTNPIQDFLSQIRIPFLGDSLMRKYENEKSPLRAELLSTEQLEMYAATLAAIQTLSEAPVPDTLIRRLDENEEILVEVRNLLIESAKNNSPIAPAGEWLLDNFYIIQEQIQIGKKHFPKGYRETLPRLAKGPFTGLPRVYSLAVEMIMHSDGRIDPDTLFHFITAYQRVSHLKLGELWAIPIMLRLALIENLRRLAATMARDRINKNLADYWADRMTEVAEKDPKSLIVITADMARSNPPMTSSFVAELTRRLLGKGPALTLPLTWIEQRLSEDGLTTNTLVHRENQKQAADQVSISNSIGSLRFVNNTDWREFVENTSIVDSILREDPVDIYGQMDFHTRDKYRHVVESIAKASGKSEFTIATLVVDLARQNLTEDASDQRTSHVGYYLVDKGKDETERRAGIQRSGLARLWQSLCSVPFLHYSGGIIIITFLLTGWLMYYTYHTSTTTLELLVVGLLSLIANSHLAAALVNWLATILIKPDFLPRLDFSKGIPDTARTIVAVPTIFSSIDDLENLIETMEVRYLANKQPNLLFALLTDFKDADVETMPDDKSLLAYAHKRINELNHKYSTGSDTFFLLHRPRLWNPVEKKWMGHERKRGKLYDLNGLLRGKSRDKFQLIAGDEEQLLNIKYVITLDTDTQLPRESAWKLIATIAHPLNKAYYDENKKRVTRGYGILQPRLATSLPLTNASWYARINSTESGIDPYTKAVSDVYQDVLKEGSYIGKGIYDIDAFEKSMGDRFPENRILSHDLLEGCHARSGLITDVMLYEEYPSTYLADMKRRHRWIRGDWQIGRWLLHRVPGPNKKVLKNPLSDLSRWKILDNLRRSLVPPALLLLLLYGWVLSPSPWFWTFTVIGIIIPPAIFAFLYSLINKPEEVSWLRHTIEASENFVNHVIQLVWSVITLPYEAFLNVDAIIRTLWRMLVSRKFLLQWDPSHLFSGRLTLTRHIGEMWIGPVMGIITFALLPILSWPAMIIASPLLVLWILSPAIAWRISIPQPRPKAELSASQTNHLRSLSRKTWAYFENFVTEDDHWLPPDNYQENPTPRIAHRTSPTNIGVSLLSSLAAWDFGYMTTGSMLERIQNTLNTLQKLDRYKGHFFNWYDTQSLVPLYPRYISTVDSGNLAACLLTLKEGLLALYDEPVFRLRIFEGLKDTAAVLHDHLKDPEAYSTMKGFIERPQSETPFKISVAKDSLSQLLGYVSELRSGYGELKTEIVWWLDAMISQCEDAYHELTNLLEWMNGSEDPNHHTIPALRDIERMSHENGTGAGVDMTLTHRQTSIEYAASLMQKIDAAVRQCIECSDYEYDFLFDKVQHYFAIGYNVEDHRRDPGFYDLLGSEARLGVYVAIAQGKIPQESWFALGRQIANSATDPVLISWSGSMFEYLMPLLMVPTFDSTLLDQTYKGAVRRHIDYGKRKGLPWGISESCFNMVHANMDYQYRAFGVPGLGLKRGLSEDYVVAPYASVMALMVEPDEAYQNLAQLSASGYEGPWGYYEAIDYTPARLQRGQTAGLVKAFMTHHQGMSFLSLAYLLLDQPMQRRFQSELHFQTSLLLLQEKIPTVTNVYTPAVDIAEIPVEAVNPELRVIHTPNTPIPEVQLLSNGRYHVVITNAGGGYSRWKDLAVTRWREDGTRDHWGTFCFIRDLETKEFWSATHQPTLKQPEHYEVIFSQDRAEFRRKDHQIDSHLEIAISPEDNVEMRRLHISNRSRKKRLIDVTSYTEVVLNIAIAEMLHPVFSNLFVQTEIVPSRHALLATRRPRAVEEKPLWMFHLMKLHGHDAVQITYETDRDQFIGRGRSIESPMAMQRETGLSGNQGSVLDPVMSIQYTIELKPYEAVTLDMVYGVAGNRDDGQNLIDKYQDKYMIDRGFELAWTHSHVALRQINATAADSLLYCRLAGSIIYANASFRADPSVILKNQRGQSGLWSHSISGDWPIVLLQIEDGDNIGLVEKLVQAHAFWRLKGLTVDLVIWNEDHGGYRQVLQQQIMSLITTAYSTEGPEKPGHIFIRSAEQLSNEDRILFQTVARVIISDKLGTLEGQLNRRKKLKPVIPAFTPQRNLPVMEGSLPIPTDLIFYNGYGGFSNDGKEYVIWSTPGNITHAPWSNVIANPHFGTVLSESGQSYTWFQNAHELRLTPWRNDPITDLGGEHFYIRDEETGKFWSPTPLPARGNTPYITRHGFGYSTFEHVEDGIHSELTVFVDIERPIKYNVVRIRNNSGRPRQISITAFVEWVLGDLRHKTMMHIITELDLNSGAIIARNSYSTEFGHLVSFFDNNDPHRTITTDREEFIGRNGTYQNPAAMTRSRLSGKTGAALDPCAVMQSQGNLDDGEEMEIVFRLGTGMHINDISYLVRQTRGRTAAREALEKIKQYWSQVLSSIQISSPDPSLDILTNGWLNYQTLSCRMWARSGYYQSGGAYGFRDQLQDVLSLLHCEPDRARQQIILCASRQFIQGDVQHWWHPPVGRGVRTRCSDDYLWLPYVTSKYVEVTGDAEILEQVIGFIESRELAKDEHSYYDLPIHSDQSATLYEHCVRAIEYGLQFGEHGLPLIGSGDWNDGMDRVGTEGKGESVWLAWFMYDTIERFKALVIAREDTLLLERIEALLHDLKENIEKHAWDGDWYKRAYFDDGTPLGSAVNEECSIDSLPQSWAILSGAGDGVRSKKAMAMAHDKLVRKEDKIIQLFDPPFDKSHLNPGYIKGYVPGVRENGGQYTHAAIWMVMAFAKMKNKARMWELLQMIHPQHHALTPEDAVTYKVEPYVIAADVYAVSGHKGRGGWTWYTGSAGWMYQLIIEYVFGLKKKGAFLSFDPCLPETWDQVRMHYKYQNASYHILMKQSGAGMHVTRVTLDGIMIDTLTIGLVADGNEHEVEVFIS